MLVLDSPSRALGHAISFDTATTFGAAKQQWLEHVARRGYDNTCDFEFLCPVSNKAVNEDVILRPNQEIHIRVVGAPRKLENTEGDNQGEEGEESAVISWCAFLSCGRWF